MGNGADTPPVEGPGTSRKARGLPDRRTRKAKQYQSLLAEWTKALPPAPAGSGIRADLVVRGVHLAIKVSELEADLLNGRRVEPQTYERLLSLLVRIQRTLGLLPTEGGKASPKSKGAKPGPKPSTLSAHAKAVLKASGGE